MKGRISKLPLGKGNKLKERSWRLTKGKAYQGRGKSFKLEKKKKEEKECVKKEEKD